jgi:hypothetical protein
MKNINKNTKTNTASTFLDRATKLTKSSATKPAVKTTKKTTKAAVPAGRRIVAAKPVTKSTKPTVNTATKPTTKPAVKTTPKRSRHTPTQNKQ